MKAKKLDDILPDGLKAEFIGSLDVKIKGLSIDSRKVDDGFVYAALKGTLADGHQYIGKAIEQGAKCILCQEVDEVKKG